jgi:hypothetical protein
MKPTKPTLYTSFTRGVADEMGRLELQFPHLLQGYSRLMELIKGKKIIDLCCKKNANFKKS